MSKVGKRIAFATLLVGGGITAGLLFDSENRLTMTANNQLGGQRQPQSIEGGSRTLGLYPVQPQLANVGDALSENAVVGGEGKNNLNRLQDRSRERWQVRRDPFNGRVKTLVNGRFVLGGDSVETGVQSFISEYSKDVLGVDADQLKLKSNEGAGRRRLEFEQVVDGLSVFGSSLVLVVEDGEVTRVQNDLVPVKKVTTTARFDLESSLGDYLSREQQRLGSIGTVSLLTTSMKPSKIFFPSSGELNLAYQAHVITMKPDRSEETFWVIIDAATGLPIRRMSMVVN